MVDTIPANFNKHGFDWSIGRWTTAMVDGKPVPAFKATFGSLSFFMHLLYAILAKVTGNTNDNTDLLAWIEVQAVPRSKGRTIRTVQECILHYYTVNGWKRKMFTVAQDTLTPNQKAHMVDTAKAWWEVFCDGEGDTPQAKLFHDWKNKVIFPSKQTSTPHDWDNAE